MPGERAGQTFSVCGRVEACAEGLPQHAWADASGSHTQCGAAIAAARNRGLPSALWVVRPFGGSAKAQLIGDALGNVDRSGGWRSVCGMGAAGVEAGGCAADGTGEIGCAKAADPYT